MLDKDFKKEWVAALRSGEFRQGKGRLKKYNGSTECNYFCCLGVAREICPALQGESNLALTWEDQELIGLSGNDHNELMKLNDGDKWHDIPRHSFKEIADYIEKNL